MFKLFRYGLAPVVLYCLVIVVASIDSFSESIIRKKTWPQTVATVVESQDFGQVAADIRGVPNTFPDPYGTLSYVVDGKSYQWQGRGRDIGITAMKPSDRITLHYNPRNPTEISTLILLGAATGSIILAAAVLFLALYIWFFWVRPFLRRGPPGIDGDGSSASAERIVERYISRGDGARLAPGVERPSAIGGRPPRASFGQRGVAGFGKR